MPQDDKQSLSSQSKYSFESYSTSNSHTHLLQTTPAGYGTGSSGWTRNKTLSVSSNDEVALLTEDSDN